MNLNELRTEWRAEILRIAEEHGARNVRVFGSSVLGTAGADSDLDLLVQMERGRTYLDLVGLQRELADLLNCEVDVVTENGLSPYFRERVLREAERL